MAWRSKGEILWSIALLIPTLKSAWATRQCRQPFILPNQRPRHLCVWSLMNRLQFCTSLPGCVHLVCTSSKKTMDCDGVLANLGQNFGKIFYFSQQSGICFESVRLLYNYSTTLPRKMWSYTVGWQKMVYLQGNQKCTEYVETKISRERCLYLRCRQFMCNPDIRLSGNTVAAIRFCPPMEVNWSNE